MREKNVICLNNMEYIWIKLWKNVLQFTGKIDTHKYTRIYSLLFYLLRVYIQHVYIYIHIFITLFTIFSYFLFFFSS